MRFFKKGKRANYKVLSAFDNYVPGFGGTAAILGFFLLGVAVASVVTVMLSPLNLRGEAAQLVAYPLMFIPAMIYARAAGMRDAFFRNGYAIDSNHFGEVPALTIFLVLLSTVATGFLMDGISSAVLPPVPPMLEQIFRQLTEGNLILNLLAVSVMAPIFEEWLLRGIILRGLLNHPRSGGRRGYHPALAIGVSALIFGVIHFNPWQALSAISIGVLMGYIYYKTGSLKLTMAMHCLNNTLAVVMPRLPIEGFEDADSWLDIFSPAAYSALAVLMAAVLALTIWYVRRIPSGKNGNCDVIEAL